MRIGFGLFSGSFRRHARPVALVGLGSFSSDTKEPTGVWSHPDEISGANLY